MRLIVALHKFLFFLTVPHPPQVLGGLGCAGSSLSFPSWPVLQDLHLVRSSSSHPESQHKHFLNQNVQTPKYKIHYINISITDLLLFFRWLPNGPHLHGVQFEDLVSWELRTSICGAAWSSPTVSVSKIRVQPQAEIAMLTTHTLKI